MRKQIRRKRLRRWLVAASVLLPLIHLPYVWLLIEDGSVIDVRLVSDYRGSWLRHYPILPGLVPELLTRKFHENETLVMIVYTLMIVATSPLIGARGRRSLIVIVTITGLYGCLAFFATQAIYAV